MRSTFDRRCLTLLELMVVLCLVGVTGGLLGIKGYHAIRRQEFEQSVRVISSKIALAEQMMLSLQTPVTVLFDDERSIELRPEGKLPDNLHHFFHRKTKLKGIEKISWHNQTPLQLTFSSSAMPRGILTIQPTWSQLGPSHLRLPGYVGKIVPTKHALPEIDESPIPSLLSSS